MRLRKFRRQLQGCLGPTSGSIQPCWRHVTVVPVHMKMHLSQQTVCECELRVASNGSLEQIDGIWTIALKKRLARPQIEIIRKHVFSRPVFDRGFLVRR